MPRSRTAAVATCVACVVGLAGCGSVGAALGSSGGPSILTGTGTPSGSSPGTGSGSSSTASGPSVGEVVRSAHQQALAAKTAHVVRTTVTGGRTRTVDIIGRIDGSNQRLRMTQAGSGSVELLTVAGRRYLKADRTYWAGRGAGDAQKAVGAKYVVVPKDKTAEAADVSIKSFLTPMFGRSSSSLAALESSGAPTTPTTFAGVPALAVTSPDGSRLVVTKAAPHRLLQVVGTGSDKIQMTFSSWDAVPPLKAPAKSQVVASAGW